MKVAIAGAAGYLGRNLARYLLHQGWQVHGLVRPSSDRHQLPDGIIVCPIKPWTPAGLAGSLEGCDAAVDLVGLQGGEDVEPERIRAANVLPAGALGEACAAAGARLVYVSSVRVYGTGHHDPIAESTPPAPTTAYGAAKVEAERILASLSGLRLTVLRLSEVYGPGDNRSMVFKMLERLRAGARWWPGNGDNLVHPCFLDDALRGMARALEAAPGGPFNIAGAEPVTIRAFIARAAALLRVEPPRVHLPCQLLQTAAGTGDFLRALGLRPPLTRSQVATLCDHRSYDLSAARQSLGYIPRVNIADGLERTLRLQGARA